MNDRAISEQQLLHEFLSYYTNKEHNGEPSFVAAEIKQHFADLLSAQPTIEPTLYGYRLEHLEFVAAILQNKGVTEENLTDVLNSVDRIVGMILKEAEEKTMKSFVKNEVKE